MTLRHEIAAELVTTGARRRNHSSNAQVTENPSRAHLASALATGQGYALRGGMTDRLDDQAPAPATAPPWDRPGCRLHVTVTQILN